MRIYLTGFMGSGKTTMGQQVATSLNAEFIDLDQQIEGTSGRSVSLIFKEDGELHFRQLEAEALRSTQALPKALIATGGGTPLFHNNMQWMLEHGITMYLEWEDAMLIDALMHQKQNRPLLTGDSDTLIRDHAFNLLLERKAVYQQSSMTLSMQGDFEKDLKLLEKACRYIW